jgi:hypothetical protein
MDAMPRGVDGGLVNKTKVFRMPEGGAESFGYASVEITCEWK